MKTAKAELFVSILVISAGLLAIGAGIYLALTQGKFDMRMVVLPLGGLIVGIPGVKLLKFTIKNYEWMNKILRVVYS